MGKSPAKWVKNILLGKKSSKSSSSKAHQAYTSLRSIVRLQALIRGHLVRRQAAATLHCVKGIVKLQAVVRGRMVRLEVRKKCSLKAFCLNQEADMTQSLKPNSSTVLGKLSPNLFACKILGSPIQTLPLNLQYDPAVPNSASKWLERWSSSHFWRSIAQKKEVLSSITYRKQSIQSVGTEPGPVMHDVGRATAASTEHNFLSISLDHGKAKHNSQKPIISQEVETAEDHPQNELERVRRNLRKISLNHESPGKAESLTELPKQKNVPLSQPEVPDSKGKPEAVIELKPRMESLSNSSVLDIKEHALVDSFPDKNKSSGEQIGIYDVENVALVFEEKICKDANASKDNHKSRRKSLPAKQENVENASKTAPSLPSYMAATESAKAKLRGLGTPRFALEGEIDHSTRRHSLSSSTNGKLSIVSPQIPIVAHAAGKDGMRSDRSLTSSSYGHGKVIRPGWRR